MTALNEGWCLGCNPDNCMGCGLAPDTSWDEVQPCASSADGTVIRITPHLAIYTHDDGDNEGFGL